MGNISVDFVDLNPQPAIITNLLLTSEDVDHGVIVGTQVGEFVTEGGTGPYLYVITDDPDSKFSIVGDALVTANPIDFFTKDMHNVTVQVIDVNNVTFTKSFIITVNQVPAAPFVDEKVITFNGVDEFMDSPYNAAISGQAKLTVSAWINMSSLAGEKTIVSHFGANGKRSFRFNIGASGRMFVGLSEDGVNQENFVGTTVMAIDTVYHVAFAFDGVNKTVQSWVNGVIDIDGVTTYSNLYDPVNEPFRIGARGDSSFPEVGFFNGWINEVSVNSDALTTLRINEIYNFGVTANVQAMTSSASLLFWLRMGDGDTFPTIQDQVASNDFTMQNMTVSNILNLVFSISHSLNFNGVDERLDTTVDFSGRNKLTIAGWFYRDLTTERLDISQANVGNTLRVKIVRNNNANVYWVIDNVAIAYSNNDTGWQFIVGVYDGTQVVVADRLKLYINGIVIAPGSAPAIPVAIGAIPDALTIGYDRGSNVFSRGNLDEVIFFDLPLTPAEVTELYNGGVVYNYNTHSQSSNILNYYRMGENMVGSNVPDETGNNDATGFNMDETNKDTNIP